MDFLHDAKSQLKGLEYDLKTVLSDSKKFIDRLSPSQMKDIKVFGVDSKCILTKGNSIIIEGLSETLAKKLYESLSEIND